MAYKALAFLRRDFHTQASYRFDFVLRVTGMLVSLSMFYFISQVFGDAMSPYLQRYGVDYFHFTLTGLTFFTLIGLSTTSLAEVISGYQQSGTLEVLFLSPTPILASLALSTLWRYCWAVGEALFYLLVADIVFGADLRWLQLLSAVPVVLLGILANAGLGLINASFVLVTKRSSPLARLLALASGLLTGTYYPIDVLPEGLRWISYLLPATHSLDALRRTTLQGASIADVWQNLLVLGGFTAVLLPIGLVAFYQAVRWAKVDGSLTQY